MVWASFIADVFYMVSQQLPHQQREQIMAQQSANFPTLAQHLLDSSDDQIAYNAWKLQQ